MNRKVLITGANGFVGSALVERLAELAEYKVIAATRKTTDKSLPQIESLGIGELGSNIEWQQYLERVDTVIHTAARVHVMNDTVADPLAEFRRINVTATENLANQCIKAGVRRLIFVSSIKVNGEETQLGKPFTIEDTPAPLDPYGQSKLEAENVLFELARESSLEVVVIRPPLIYGPGVKANFRTMISMSHKGFPLPLGAINNKRSMVALDNLVDLIVTCIDHSQAANKAFLVSDDEDVSVTELLKQMAQTFGKSPRLLPVPMWLLALGAKIIGKPGFYTRLCGSLQVDISQTKSTLEWQPPVTIQKALQSTVKAFLNEKNV